MTKTERIPLRDILNNSNDSGALRRFAARLEVGAICIYPTETIYGIGGLYGVASVSDSILRAKNRPAGKEMILLAPSMSFFSRLLVEFPPAAEKLAQSFWPGLVTFVLPLRRGTGSIAVRVSNHPFVAALFRYVSSPLYSTSANVSSEPYVNDPDAIYACFAGRVDYMIDAGPLPSSPPSTVVQVAGNGTVQIVREGAIPSGEIFAALDR